MSVAIQINRLYQSARSGDKRSEKELFEYLSARFLLFVHRRIRNKQLAEEIVQQTLLTIAGEYSSFDARVSFSAWAYKILDNRILAAIQEIKREAGRKSISIDIAAATEQSQQDVDPSLKRQLIMCLRKITAVNVRYSRIINLHFQGYDTAEICRRVKIVPATFYSLLSRGRKMLEQCLNTGDIQ